MGELVSKQAWYGGWLWIFLNLCCRVWEPYDGWGEDLWLVMDVLLELINQNTSVLPNHHLQYIMVDSHCTTQGGLSASLSLSRLADPIVVLDSACSSGSKSSALLLGLLQTPQLTFGSTSMDLSDRQLYPYFMVSAYHLHDVIYCLSNSTSQCMDVLQQPFGCNGCLAILSVLLIGPHCCDCKLFT